MIVDKIENAFLYNGINEQIDKSLKVLGSREIVAKPQGRYDVDGDKLFYLVQKYSTKPRDEGQMEAHEKYIDIQYVVDGQESMFVENISNCKLASVYDENNDLAMYDVPEKFSDIYMSKGMFCILFPEDGHLPCRTVVDESKVHKVVFKIQI